VSPASRTDDDWVREGEILAGKYKVERVVARGGMGVVVAAIHQQLDQRVALKFMLPEGVENTAAVSRFLREARAAVRLRSEHVARVLDVGTAETGSPYIVMEYLDGEDLSVLLEREGQLPVRSAVTYLLQACEAVAEAHALGIIHRDLKPSNLFLTRRPDGSPCVKVLDFGIAKHADGIDSAMTKTQTLLGTPFYMSPEQLRSSRDVDPRTDIWALGMILYELLAGHVAFARETLPELCSAIILEPVPPLRESRPDVPRDLEAIIVRALSKEASARHPSLAELSSALAPFASGTGADKRIKRTLLGGIAAPSEAPPPEPAPDVMALAIAPTEPPPSSDDAEDRAGLPAPRSKAFVTARIAAFDFVRRSIIFARVVESCMLPPAACIIARCSSRCFVWIESIFVFCSGVSVMSLKSMSFIRWAF
jgi:serine/threonine-protein kinase